MLPGALSHMEGAIFLRFLPLRHSISQHFIVPLMRHALRRTAAVVEQMGGVIADLPSLQVRIFQSTYNFVILAGSNSFVITYVTFMHITQCDCIFYTRDTMQ